VGEGGIVGEEKRIRPAEMRSEVDPRILRSGDNGRMRRKGGMKRSGRNMKMRV
jgi:hypothetical protein